MDDLRWFLLGLGVLIVAAVYGFSRWQEGRRGRGRREAFGTEPDIDEAFRGLDAAVADEPQFLAEEDRIDFTQELPDELPEIAPEPVVERVSEEPARRPAEKLAAAIKLKRDVPPPAPEPPVQEKIVVLNVLTQDQHPVPGRVLVQALETAGLSYGENAIYHRTLEARTGSVSLFSAANALNPGTFEPEALDAMHSPGVALFLQLPGPVDGLVAFEQMLEAAKVIAGEIDGKLLDARRCTLTNQAVEHIREELREYRRLSHLAARQAH